MLRSDIEIDLELVIACDIATTDQPDGDSHGQYPMTPSATHEPRSVHPSADPEAPTIAFTWSGAFIDLDLERAYRREVWPLRIRQQGVLCGIGSVLFLLAGFGPIMEFGFTPMVVFITFFRILASAWGVAVFLYTRATRSNRLFPALLMLFIVCLGCYEAVEAVLTYTPDLEFSTPFTLLIIFLLYLLFPLHLNYILPPAMFSSIIYVSGLKIFVVRDWNNLIQLSLFFVAANVLGSFLLTRISRANRTQFAYTRHILRLNARLRAEIEAKNTAYAKLEELAVTDVLTQVPNRRKFMDIAHHEWAVAQRYERPLSIMVMDVDHFKRVNDVYGHSAGDSVLKELCHRIKGELRETDCLARLGGEEFGLIMPFTDAEQAQHLAERLRNAVSSTPMKAQEHVIQVTISIGVAERMRDKPDSFQQMFKRADNNLYQAKDLGRNRVQA